LNQKGGYLQEGYLVCDGADADTVAVASAHGQHP
jgi:hypothetical protein